MPNICNFCIGYVLDKASFRISYAQYLQSLPDLAFELSVRALIANEKVILNPYVPDQITTEYCTDIARVVGENAPCSKIF